MAGRLLIVFDIHNRDFGDLQEAVQLQNFSYKATTVAGGSLNPTADCEWR